MVTPIRINEINGNTCPTDDEFCHYDEFHVDITVEKKANAEPRPVYIHTWGLECDDELLIERVKKEKCDPMFSPMYCGGQPMCLSEKYPSTVLTVPGTYRFRMKNNKPLNWDDDFAIERSEIHPEYAALWLQQQQLCCCQASK
jgi:hypothetical protein